MENQLTVIDFFCGAGGFSQGFKQQGFDIVMGIDHWQPAINTFNKNFNKNFKIKNVLDFELSIDEIDNLPNTDVIIGSPPCVSFSTSNKSGKADKELGMRLIYAFFRVVVVKKYQSGSILKAWFMENVANSQKYLPEVITFIELNLQEWALKNNLNPEDAALVIKDNTIIINSADFGSFQARKRAISGEVINEGKLIEPKKTNESTNINGLLPYNTLGNFLNKMPSPFSDSNDDIIDPNYGFSLNKSLFTDHFYDTGIYECDWNNSRFLKLNHPYMGKMSFPEREDAPCRTITATKISNSREAIILKSEIERSRNGAYRTLTVREAASIMSFPITYQFVGSENTKWRLVGNAVCPKVSAVLANTVLENYNKPLLLEPILLKIPNLEGIANLNNPILNSFEKPKRKNQGSRFRRHPFKDGNITVTLSNYNISENHQKVSNWQTSIQYGTGHGFPTQEVPLGYYSSIEALLSSFEHGKNFISFVNNGFSEQIADSQTLQKMYEEYNNMNRFLEPTKLVEYLAQKIENLGINGNFFEQTDVKIFENKDKVPLKQLFALYAMNKIATIAESY